MCLGAFRGVGAGEGGESGFSQHITCNHQSEVKPLLYGLSVDLGGQSCKSNVIFVLRQTRKIASGGGVPLSGPSEVFRERLKRKQLKGRKAKESPSYRFLTIIGL